MIIGTIKLYQHGVDSIGRRRYLSDTGAWALYAPVNEQTTGLQSTIEITVSHEPGFSGIVEFARALRALADHPASHEPGFSSCEGATTYAVVVCRNDRKQTHIQTFKCDLDKDRADQIAMDLNAAFASEGVNWFARVKEEE